MNILILGGSGSIGLDLIKCFYEYHPSYSISATCSDPAKMNSIIPSVNWISYIDEPLVHINSVCEDPFDIIYIVSGAQTLRNQSGSNIIMNHSQSQLFLPIHHSLLLYLSRLLMVLEHLISTLSLSRKLTICMALKKWRWSCFFSQSLKLSILNYL